MAAFSSFPFDSSSLLQLPTSSALFDQPNSNSLPHPQNPNTFVHSSSNSVAAAADNTCTVMDSSSSEVTDKAAATAVAVAKKRKCRSLKGYCANSAHAKDTRKQKKNKEEMKEPPTDYIHVRARRGQATDSHSLAERVRRERISERMKLLQALVPGCDKVTGKALMLDEIINYVQSLQNQVEFLSMKLASVNPMFYDFGMDLESFMVSSNDQDVNNLAGLQECHNLTAPNSYHLLENTAIFSQPQNPGVLAQGSRQGLWEMDEQRQKIINQSGFSNNSLFSFH